jgi:thiosulfate dehydrogenase [quinone] large subunit
MATPLLTPPTARTDGPTTAAGTAGRTGTPPDAARHPGERYAWALTRIGLGFLFLWAFLDKLFGLGHDVPRGESWLNGGNPTKGYLESSTGPLDGLFQGMAGGWLVNVLFMAGLLAVGLALMLGVARTLATIGGVALVLLMWASHLPPAANPFLDDHVIYALVFVGLYFARADRTLGLGDRWARLPVVRKFPILR